MQELKKPIHDLSKAFVRFKEQETKHGEKYLVKPSGSLESQLAHYLNQPSISTSGDRLENGETADEHSPCTRMLMDNAFQRGHAMMLDHVHRRSVDSVDIEDEGSSVLKRHESFTFDILASSEAKVIILYGGKVQKRLLKVRKFAFFLLWGRFKGILVGPDREDNHKEADTRYRYRRVFSPNIRMT